MSALRPRRVHLALPVLVFCGCQQSPLLAFVPEGLPEGVRVSVLGEQGGAVVFSTGLLPYEVNEPVLAGFEERPDLIHVAAWSSESLSAMNAPGEEELIAAPLRPAEPADARLTSPQHVRSAIVDGDQIEAVEEAWDVPLTTDWCRIADPCDVAPVEAHSIIVDERDTPFGVKKVLRVDDDRAVVLPRGSPWLYEVQLPDGPSMRLTQLSTSTGIVEAVKTSKDEIWVVHGEGRVSILRSDPWTLEEGPAYGDASETRATITASEPDFPFEVFVFAADSGSVVRSDGGPFEDFYSFGPLSTDQPAHGFAWTGPGSVAVTIRGPNELVLLGEGEPKRVPLPNEPEVLELVDGVGLVVGTDLRGLFYWDGEALIEIPGVSTFGRVRRLAAWDRGVAFAINDAVGWWLPGFGICGDREYGGSTGQIQEMERFPSGLLFGANVGSFSDLRVTFLEAVAPSIPVCEPPP